ncbi:MAG: Eco29kI family restriction endonuclease [Dehalococcoidia bacterium]
MLIEKLQPVWNRLIDGFGIHDPGRRRPQERSKWDTIHPGRPFANRLPPNRRTVREILAALEAELRS